MPNIAGAVSTTLAMLVFVLSHSQTAAAQDVAAPVQTSSGASSSVIVERYPSGSIQSVMAADQALADVLQQRSQAEARFSDAERACYSKFFVTSCIDAAKEVRRRALVEIQQVEIEANALKRRARVEQRDKALADKAPLIAPIVKPVKEPNDKDAATQKKDSDSAQHSAASRDRVAQHEAKLERLKTEESADAQKRAEKVAAFEKKARDAQEHQRELAARKAEKERNRPAKASSDAPVTD